jgi:hypothetical protein
MKPASELTDEEIDALSHDDAYTAMCDLVNELLPPIRDALRVNVPAAVARGLATQLMASFYDTHTVAGIAAVMLVQAAQGEVS